MRSDLPGGGNLSPMPAEPTPSHTRQPRVVALRGATTLDIDDEAHMVDRVQVLVAQMLERNEVDLDDLISILFTATDDVHCAFPALAARRMGFTDVPLMCARELAVDGATPRCIRVMVHLNSKRTRAEMHHVYLEGAVGLRDDLPE